MSEVKVLSPCAGRVLVVRGPGRVPAQAGLTTGRRYRAGLSRAASPGVSVSTADIYTAVDISTYLHIYTVTPAHVRLDSHRVARPRHVRNLTNKFRHTDPSKVIIINIYR